MSIVLNREELAWAAGFFDGEGCIIKTTTKSLNHSRMHVYITIAQTDTYVLERFKRAVGGMGRICKRRRMKSIKHSQRWDYIVSTFESGQAVIAMLWPWLSPIKRKQAHGVLLAVISQPPPFSGPTARSVTRRRYWDERQKDPDYYGTKLTALQVSEIHKQYKAGVNCTDLAKTFGVSWWTIRAVVNGTRWSHKKPPRTAEFADEKMLLEIVADVK